MRQNARTCRCLIHGMQQNIAECRCLTDEMLRNTEAPGC